MGVLSRQNPSAAGNNGKCYHIHLFFYKHYLVAIDN